MKTISLLIWLTAQAFCFAVEDASIVAAGDWSTPVEGGHGNALRGRLLLCKSLKDNARAYYIEIQDCANVWGNNAEVYCDLRPGGGWHMEERDAAGALVPIKPAIFTGGMPGAEWITVHCDSTVRLRISPYGTSPIVSTNDYFVSGTLTIAPPADRTGIDIWRGKLEFPTMKVTIQEPSR